MNIQIEQQPLPVAGGAAVGTPDSKSSLVAVLSLLKPLVMWPLRFLRAVVVVLSRPVLQFLWALVWPFVVLARCFYALLMLPLDLVLKFEALIKFILAAVLVGLLAGLFLHGASTTLSSLLGLNPEPNPEEYTTDGEESHAGRTVAQYRQARKARKAKAATSVQRRRPPQSIFIHHDTQTVNSNRAQAFSTATRSPTHMSLAAQTILEEDSSSSYGM